MATNVDPYCQIHGWDFSSIVYDTGIEPSAGAIGIEEISVPGQKYADLRSKGRGLKKYKIKARSTDRDEIEEFLYEVNSAPEDSIFYPFDAERHARIASAHAGLKPPKLWGAGKIFYEADAEIACRESWLNGPKQGINMGYSLDLPAVSESISNEGHERSPISYMQIGGFYDGSSYIAGLSVRITPDDSDDEEDRKLDLLDHMCVNDVFEIDYRGNVLHTWKTNFQRLWADISVMDLRNRYSGGTRIGNTLKLTNGDFLLIQFHGPLPISGDPQAVKLTLDIDEIGGTGGTFQKSTSILFTDGEYIEHDDLVVGENTIYVPGLEGEGLVMLGVQADSGTSNYLILNDIEAQVKRYVSPSKIPYSDPGEDFVIRVESDYGTQSKFLEVDWHNRYWY
jgi:hypothetical protein